MWTGVLVLVGIAALVGIGQWIVTRPTSRRPIDPSRARAENDRKYGPTPPPPGSDGGWF